MTKGEMVLKAIIEGNKPKSEGIIIIRSLVVAFSTELSEETETWHKRGELPSISSNEDSRDDDAAEEMCWLLENSFSYFKCYYDMIWNV